jgi:tetratricopeptide (TPR) repeat protein
LAAQTPEWLEQHSKNYYVLMDRAKRLMEEEKWAEAKEPLQTLLEHFPDQVGPGSAHVLLAAVHRKLEEAGQERLALSRLAVQDADAVDAYARLMELAEAEGDWAAMAKNAERYLAVNPMVLTPHQQMARAAEALDNRPAAIRALENCLILDSPDPAQTHFRLSKLMRSSRPEQAKRHVLMALEEAPRFREAHQLLLALEQGTDAQEESSSVSPPPQGVTIQPPPTSTPTSTPTQSPDRAPPAPPELDSDTDTDTDIDTDPDIE